MIRGPGGATHRLRKSSDYTGKAYVVRDRTAWNSLPKQVQEHALKSLNEAFRFDECQLMQAELIDEDRFGARATRFSYINLNFVDGVVRLYADADSATRGFGNRVRNQVDALTRRIPNLRSFYSGLYSRHAVFTGGWRQDSEGTSFTLKHKYEVGNQVRSVCVSESSISLKAAFEKWWGFSDDFNARALMPCQLRWLGEASSDEKHTRARLAFGKALGKLMAHEIRHQLGKSENGQGHIPVHDDSALPSDEELRRAREEAVRTGRPTPVRPIRDSPLGADGAPFWKPNIAFSSIDRWSIVNSMNELAKLQGNKKTESIRRN